MTIMRLLIQQLLKITLPVFLLLTLLLVQGSGYAGIGSCCCGKKAQTPNVATKTESKQATLKAVVLTIQPDSQCPCELQTPHLPSIEEKRLPFRSNLPVFPILTPEAPQLIHSWGWMAKRNPPFRIVTLPFIPYKRYLLKQHLLL